MRQAHQDIPWENDAEIAAFAAKSPVAEKGAIRLVPGELPRIVGEGVLALKAARAPIYSRGGQLVRPIRLECPEAAGGVSRAAGALILRPVDSDWMRLTLAGASAWAKWDTRAKKWKPADPPTDIAHSIVAVPDIGNWPVLRAVVAHPVLTFEGRRISGGYDVETQLLVDAPGRWPELPVKPTQEEAAAALTRLRHHFRFYPWQSETDAAVALSLVLTVLMRPILDAAPLHAIDSPTPGTGKSLLVDAAAILATGGRATVLDFAGDQAETGKRLDGLLMAGDNIIALDNVEAPLEGPALCQVLTQPVRRIRPLGSSAMVTAPCTATVAATGNNLVLKGDIVRRAIVCRLDAEVERPELRTIEQDLIEETYRNRGCLVADAQTIVAAYIAAGCPGLGLSTLGSYGQWTKLVRAPLVWAGAADPVASMERVREADPSRAEAAAVYRAWYEALGGDPLKVAEVVSKAEDHPELRESLTAVCAQNGKVDGRVLAYWLRSHKDSHIGGLVLRARPGHKGTMRWRMSISGGWGDGRDGGDSTTQRGENGSEIVTFQGNRAETSLLSQSSLPDSEVPF